MKIYEICFSPTGGTKRVSECLAKEWSKEFISIDLSDSQKNFHQVSLTSEDVALIAVPSYGGRVPAPAAERIGQIRGNGAKAIIVCVYGNRAYDDTLLELSDCVRQVGFSVVAAIAAIAEHSIAHRYATNRPDENDYKRLKEFAGMIGEKLNHKDYTEPVVPGHGPYKKGGKAGIVPRATRACTVCGICVSKCPVGAIDKCNPSKVNKSACISCMRCVTVCPHNARKVNGILLAIVNMMLKKACSERKECELYI